MKWSLEYLMNLKMGLFLQLDNITGKFFIKEWNLKKPVLYKGKEILKIDVRPYKINLDDKVVLSNNREHPFRDICCYDDVTVDYDESTGNFHKSINPDSEDFEFQFVLVTKSGGPGGHKIDEQDFMTKIDAEEMHFPNLSDKPSKDMTRIFGDVCQKLGIKLINFDENSARIARRMSDEEFFCWNGCKQQRKNQSRNQEKCGEDCQRNAGRMGKKYG